MQENLPDLIDRASSFIDRSLLQNICHRENFRIRKIEKALEDIANGNYGICERCGEDIAIQRLKANPVPVNVYDAKLRLKPESG